MVAWAEAAQRARLLPGWQPGQSIGDKPLDHGHAVLDEQSARAPAFVIAVAYSGVMPAWLNTAPWGKAP